MKLKGITVSERIFEAYLLERGIKFQYERKLKGIKKPVDYSFEVEGVTVRCDVKEWEVGKPMEGAGVIDAYGPIRDKIDEGKKKFKEYKGKNEPCGLVLYNPGYQPIFLDEITIYGAMLGNIGMVFPIKTTGPAAFDAAEGHQQFLGGGKMSYKKKPLQKGWPQNTTISTIIVPGQFNLHLPELGIAVEKHEKEHGELKAGKERLKVVWEISKSLGASPLVKNDPLVLSKSGPPKIRAWQ